MEIQDTLVQQIKRGNIVLFFGAGAAFGSCDQQGNKIPMGDALRDILADEFLAGNEKDRSLEEVANFAENNVGRAEIDRFLSNYLRQFQPNYAIQKLPEFMWRAVFSTNYDLLLETAYNANDNPAQKLVTFHKDISGMDRRISATERPLPFYKLHGCIDQIYQTDAPLVLSSSTYVDVRENRPRMFNRLVDAASDFSVLFVGTKLADPHIKALLAEVEKASGPSRPMFYLIAPNLTPNDESYLASKRFQPIRAGFDEFIMALEEKLDATDRRVYGTLPIQEHPIQQHFNQIADVPANLLSFVTNDVEFVHTGIRSSPIDPKLFYKGQSNSWSPIEQSFDFMRDIYDSIMLQLIGMQKDKLTGVDAIVIKGVAGAGKTVFCRRLAYDLAIKYGEIVLFATPGSNIRPEPLIELYALTGKSVILFIDQASDLAHEIRQLVLRLEKEKVPITLVLIDTQTAIGERFADLDEVISHERYLRKMSGEEIRKLLQTLEQHNCLGELEKLDADGRKHALEELADKQLLVALYEATQGRPLEDILLDEYHRILYDDAQELYLLVCTLHRFEVPARAGLVRRLMGISYNDFEGRFLGPLTDLVFAEMDPRSRDYCYRTRHSQIANIVFRRVLDSQSKQVEQFLHIMRGLNTTYSSDNEALRRMINFYNLRELVGSFAERKKILEVAASVAPNDAFVLQQQAMLEMNTPKGDLSAASAKLDQAQILRPNDKALKHTRANLLSREAEASEDWLTRKSLRASARNLLRECRSGGSSAYVEALIAKIANDELVDRLAQLEDNNHVSETRDVLRLAEDAEKAISAGRTFNPDFDNLLREEVRLAEIFGNKSAGIKILREALIDDPTSKYAALAYSRILKVTEPEQAAEVIKAALTPRPNDKQLNQALFETMMLEGDEFREQIKPILDKSYTLEDGNLNMHIRAMRYHFMRGDRESYDRNVSAVSCMRTDRQAIFTPRFPVKSNNSDDKIWTGRVTSISARFGLLEVGGLMGRVFLSPRGSVDDDVWDALHEGSVVTFELCFNGKGAIANKVQSADVP